MTELEIYEKLGKVLDRIEKRKSLFISSLHNPRLELNVPIPITLENDRYQFIAYSSDLDIFGCGETEYEAIEDLRQSIVDLYFDLREEKLGSDLKKIFSYLQSVVIEK
jgi:hypothetical protein